MPPENNNNNPSLPPFPIPTQQAVPITPQNQSSQLPPVNLPQNQPLSSLPPKTFPTKKLVIGLVLVLAVLIIGAGSFFAYQKTNEKKESIAECSKLTQETEGINQETLTTGKISKSSLISKMSGYNNYQLDITSKVTRADSNLISHQKILRANDKLASFSDITPLVDYLDLLKCKRYILTTDTNEYADSKDVFEPGTNPINMLFDFGTPQYYLKPFSEVLTFKNEEGISNKKVNVYEGIPITNTTGDTLLTVSIDSGSGLPVKITSESAKVKVGLIREFEFSRINEVTEDEVVLPASAKKVSKKQLEKANKFLDQTSNPQTSL